MSMLKRPKRILCCVLAAVLVFAAVAFAVYENRIVYPKFHTQDTYKELELAGDSVLSIEELAMESDAVVCADVTAVTASEELELPTSYEYNYVRIKVREVLKGDVAIGDSFYVRDTGNSYDYTNENGESISGWITLQGEPLMEKGNRVVLFLSSKDIVADGTLIGGKPTYTIYPAGAGKFFYDHDGLYHCSLLYSAHILKILSMGQPDHTVILDDLVPKTLDELTVIVNNADREISE